MQGKITIVGAGRVGSSSAWLAAIRELGNIVLVNRTENTAKGIALDISQSLPVEKSNSRIIGASDYTETKNSDIIVITAGAQRTAGMTREQLLETNAVIVKDIAKQTAKYSPNAVMVVVTNPLDAMVAVAAKHSGFPKERIMGMAGILDSARFASFIAQEANVSVKKVSALVLGSHGGAMVPIISNSKVNGKPLAKILSKEKIDALVKRTIGAGEEIIKLQESSAYYAPAAAVVQMIEAVLKNKKLVLPVTAHLNGEYGIKGMFFGAPAILGKNGVEKIIELKISEEEKKQLQNAAEKIRQLVSQIE